MSWWCSWRGGVQLDAGLAAAVSLPDLGEDSAVLGVGCHRPADTRNAHAVLRWVGGGRLILVRFCSEAVASMAATLASAIESSIESRVRPGC